MRLDEIREKFGGRVAIRADLVVEVSMTLASAPVNAAAAADERCLGYPGRDHSFPRPYPIPERAASHMADEIGVGLGLPRRVAWTPSSKSSANVTLPRD